MPGDVSVVPIRDTTKRTGWARVREVIWDGEKPEEERKLIQRLDMFILYVDVQNIN